MTVQLLHLSDLHIGADASERLAGIDCRASLLRVLAAIARDEPPQLPLLLTGDIAAHGELAAYQWLNQQLLATGREVYWLPGNHDAPALMAAGLADFPARRQITMGRWLLLLLDSSQPTSSSGLLSAAELAAVSTAVADRRADHLLLALHHPLTAIGCRWLDAMCVANSDELAARLAGESRLRGVLCGHVHQHSVVAWQGAEQITTPSTCFQFAAASRDYALAALPPAYRRVSLAADGAVTTALIAVDPAS